MDLGLRDKIALVTGAGSGIGQAIALSLAGEGARLIATDVREETAAATAAAAMACGVDALGLPLDVTNYGQAQAVVQLMVTVKDTSRVGRQNTIRLLGHLPGKLASTSLPHYGPSRVPRFARFAACARSLRGWGELPGGGSEVRGDASGGVRERGLCISYTLRRLRWIQLVLAGVAVVLLALTVPGTLVSTASACPDLARAPSSRWRVTVDQGVAWLVTPCGDRFFSLGVNVVDGGAGGDHPGYTWAQHYPDPIAFSVATRARLLAWGFNTLGGYSMPAQVLKLPVTPELGLGYKPGFHWVDPFHPDMADAMKAWAEYLVGPYRGSPLRIGYFSDNEVGWWNGTLWVYFIQQPSTNYTKHRLVDLLREHYGGDWRRFSADFVADGLVSFDALLEMKGRVPKLRPGGHGSQLVRRWTRIVAERYYRLTSDALRAADPDALILGDRLPIYYDPDAVRAMAPYVDVVSVNYDVDSPDGWLAHYFFDGLRQLAGKPVLISEWFFSAQENRSGNLNPTGLMTVPTQVDRARGGAAAARNFAGQPAIVGLHWYLFYDEPVRGRGDHNFGLIDIHNEPYQELVTSLAHVNPQLMDLHRKAAPVAVATTGLPYARIDPTQPTLDEWPKPKSLLLPMTASPGEVAFGDIFGTWSERGLAFALIGMDYYDADLLSSTGDFPRSEAFRLWIGVDVGAGPQRFVLNLIPRERKDGDPYDYTPELCRAEGTGCVPVPGVETRSFWFSQPRINAKVLIPWEVLGVKSASRPAEVRLDVAATTFFRSRWMSLSGLAPEEALSRPDQWQRLRLSTAVGSTLESAPSDQGKP